jgi:hypothetical protein
MPDGGDAFTMLTTAPARRGADPRSANGCAGAFGLAALARLDPRGIRVAASAAHGKPHRRARPIAPRQPG